MTEILVNDGTILNDHLKIIHQIAWNLHTASGHDVEDLYSEGCLQYLLRRNTFNNAFDTKTTTYIWNIVKNSLIDYLRKQPLLVLSCSDEFLAYLTENFLGTNCENHRVREKFICDAY